MKSSVGLIGLGTMGAALARNIASRGFQISVWNRSREKIAEFAEKFPNENFYVPSDFEDFIESLEKPRKIILMVPAGEAMNEVMNTMIGFLEAGDTVMDGGNSHFRDTEIFQRELEPKGVFFLGTGISGGEIGALKGPSIMPGGSMQAWQNFEPILSAISAEDFSGKACVSYMGNSGAGHYVKMIHNGIEYAELEMISEAYDFFHSIYRLKNEEIADIFEKWNAGKLSSYLTEIAVNVLRQKEDNHNLVDLISDKAGQKGTGLWTGEESLHLGVPALSITSAVYMRILSSNKDSRIELNKIYPKHEEIPNMIVPELVDHFEKALLMTRLINFEQGFEILRAADSQYKFGLNLAEISRIWQGGCIIRNKMLNEMHQAFTLRNDSIYYAEFSKELIKTCEKSLRTILGISVKYGLPMIAFSSALTHFDTSRRITLPTNLVQGMRDFFGAHGYERIDREGKFHTNWL